MRSAAAHGGPDPALLPRLVLWGLAAIVLGSTRADPDLWGHVRFGLDTLAAGHVRLPDRYAFTDDQPWVNHEWLAEVLLAAAYSAGRAAGLLVVKAALAAALCAVILRELRDRCVPPVVRDGWLLLAALGAVLTTLTIRPHLFSLVLFAALLRLLRQAGTGHPRRLVLIPPLMALWANLHGGWLVGGCVLAIWTGEQLMRADATRGTRRAWLWAAAASAVATLVTPFGWQLWIFLVETVRLSREGIPEWSSVWTLPLRDSVPWLGLLPVALAGLWRLRRAAPAASLTIAVLLLASAQVIRLVPFATVAVVMLAAPAFAGARDPRHRPRRTAGRTAVLIRAAVAGVAMVTAVLVTRELYRPVSCLMSDAVWAPDRGMTRRLAAAGLTGRLLTWFDWGEYALWHLGPRLQVSMDGRRETVFSTRVRALHQTLYWKRDGWSEALDALQPDYIWLPTRLPVVAALRTTGWHVLGETADSVVFGRQPNTLPPAPAVVSACFPD